jgi:hypothetical protein
MRQKLDDCQTYRYHKGCGKHKVEIRTDKINDFIDIPILSIIMYYTNVLNTIDITKTMPSLASVISCTGDALVYRTHTEEGVDPVNAMAFEIGFTLSRACEAKDKTGYSINFTEIIDTYMFEFVRITDIQELKRQLNIIKERFTSLE